MQICIKVAQISPKTLRPIVNSARAHCVRLFFSPFIVTALELRHFGTHDCENERVSERQEFNSSSIGRESSEQKASRTFSPSVTIRPASAMD